jgi:hypothetical protein
MMPTENEERIERDRKTLSTLEFLTNEVLYIRKIVDPLSWKERALLIALSAFAGGALTNLAIALFETMFLKRH